MKQILSSTKHVARKDHKCNYCSAIIQKGTSYMNDFVLGDGAYQWKSHIECGLLASKLNWFDDFDDGLTEDGFHECVSDAYSDLMSNEFNEIWESKEFKIPPFLDQLQFLITHYKISEP